jgi:hypothetical protein
VKRTTTTAALPLVESFSGALLCLGENLAEAVEEDVGVVLLEDQGGAQTDRVFATSATLNT